MAFARSNSLSINTGATNTLFGQQQQQQQQSQATPGNATSLFGGGNNAGGSSSLFGSWGNQNNQQSNNNGGGLFSKPADPKNNNNTSSLFGGNAQAQPQTSSLFGGNAQAQPQPAQSSLFGASTQQPAPTSSLFGSSTVQSGPGRSSLFNSLQQQPNPQQAPSLLGATMRAQNAQPSLFGSLSMGQTPAMPPQNAISAVKVDLENLRPTTRFEDCIDQVKQELEGIDKLIQQQEHFARQVEAFLPQHEQNIHSLAPDVALVKDKIESTEQSLAQDAHGVDDRRKAAEKTREDFDRCQRIITNLGLPQAYQYSNLGFKSIYGSQQQRPQPAPPSTSAGETYDTDLIGNYFLPMAQELERTMNQYSANLFEIEAHMGVIESLAVTQSQKVAYRNSGIGNGAAAYGAQANDTLRELTETLRGFEQSILGVASVVGECREGVNELVLGRPGVSG